VRAGGAGGELAGRGALPPSLRIQTAFTVSRRAGLFLIAAFLVTRLAGAWLADHPEAYGAGGTEITGDPEVYRFWGLALVKGGLEPYAQVDIEYPPGSIPFLVAPVLWDSTGHSYRSAFIASMVVVDAAGLAALVVMARRGGSMAGAWLWVGIVPLLGPIAYVRLDLVAAVATLWALERASSRAWSASGAWLGFATAAKLYPALLVPSAWLSASRRSRFTLAFVALAALPVLPFAGAAAALLHDVGGYHSARGIQVESTWGALLLLAGRLGYNVDVAYNFGAFHIGGPAWLKLPATVLSIAVVAGVAWLVGRSGDRSAARFAAGAVAAVALGLVAATVFSPQFLLWIAALGAGWACLDEARARGPVLLLAPAAALSQAIYPFLYNRLLAGELLPLVLLGTRNVLVALTGARACACLWRTAATGHHRTRVRKRSSPRTTSFR
jgi:Glycosyltransferase family 87